MNEAPAISFGKENKYTWSTPWGCWVETISVTGALSGKRIGTLIVVVGLAAAMTAPVASAHAGYWDCDWDTIDEEYDCQGYLASGNDICDINWTDDDRDNHYHDKNAHVTSSECVGKAVFDLIDKFVQG